LWRLGFHPRVVRVGFVVDKIALREVMLRVILFFLVFSTVICFTHDQQLSFNMYSSAGYVVVAYPVPPAWYLNVDHYVCM
jgi:quinol-cytochrome oxidoreductase complex cytochrome b subunit